LLSAAELSSSKQYLLQKKGKGKDAADQWTIAYQLPIADGALLSGDIGLRVEYVDSKEEELSDSAVKLLFPAGSRLWKSDVGPLKPNYKVW
jgi:hypothetical protein